MVFPPNHPFVPLGLVFHLFSPSILGGFQPPLFLVQHPPGNDLDLYDLVQKKSNPGGPRPNDLRDDPCNPGFPITNGPHLVFGLPGLLEHIFDMIQLGGRFRNPRCFQRCFP